MFRIVRLFLFTLLALGAVAAGAGYFAFLHYTRELPDYQQLAAYDPPMVTRVQAGDGRMLAEFAVENRVFVPIGAIPKRVISAFLSAEDKNFYSHPGIDLQGIIRAAIQNALALGSNRRPIGASTITQQVAKNFLLTNEVSFERKLKEAVLAYRIEQAFSKDRILELYLNEIYLGFNSYGVAAAALNYFNRPLAELTVAEAAYRRPCPRRPTTIIRCAGPRPPRRGATTSSSAWPRTASSPARRRRPHSPRRSRSARAPRPRRSGPTSSPRRCGAS